MPDVFRSPFQTAPLDLDSDAFYPARRDALDAQLSAIADGHAGAATRMAQPVRTAACAIRLPANAACVLTLTNCCPCCCLFLCDV